VSSANAFVLRGGVPVFVDIREDTLNIDERLIEAAITPRTKAIVPVHYAGVSCEMDMIMQISNRYQLSVIEDAAQGVMSSYKGRPLGSIGDLGAYSFHETKNVISGEGGALIVNDLNLAIEAEIIREKGTDRSRFFRGEVDKYTWQEKGSSFLPGEMVAAFLWAQLQDAKGITNTRLETWNYYDYLLKESDIEDKIRRPFIPKDCEHNAHMYYILLSPKIDRTSILEKLKNNGINAVFHYVPLHSSPGGLKYGRAHGNMMNTDIQSSQLIRLPIWYGITKEQQERVVDILCQALN
jgi:dTDP-4-amino-4,6-dideoxygalactose transaminase